jgi:hypothetical protein
VLPARPVEPVADILIAEPGDDDVEVLFPIADYDELTTDEVLGLLPKLYSDELDVVERRERGGEARLVVLDTLAELRRSGTDADRDAGSTDRGQSG